MPADLAKALRFTKKRSGCGRSFPKQIPKRERARSVGPTGRSRRGTTSRAIALRKNWSLPYSTLGALLVRRNRDTDAEAFLREAIKLDAQDNLALRILASVRLRSGDAKEALQRPGATLDKDSSASSWLLRALAERATGDNIAAVSSLNRVLEIDPANFSALMERAELHTASGEKLLAIADLRAAELLIKKGDKVNFSRLASNYELAGAAADAQRIAADAGLISQSNAAPGDGLKVKGTPEEIEAANSDDPDVARKALESLLKQNPDNAMLLARLGALIASLMRIARLNITNVQSPLNPPIRIMQLDIVQLWSRRDASPKRRAFCGE